MDGMCINGIKVDNHLPRQPGNAEAGSRIDKASNICFYTTKIMEGQIFQPYSIKKNAPIKLKCTARAIVFSVMIARSMHIICCHVLANVCLYVMENAKTLGRFYGVL